MSSVLLDTNVIVDGLVVEGASISILTMFELVGGITSAVDPAQREARQRRYRRMASLFDPIPVSARVLASYDDIDAAVVAIGRKPRPRRIDLIIAATARAYGLPLLTTNIDDYRGLTGLIDVRRP